MKWRDLLKKADPEQKRAQLLWVISLCQLLFLVLSIVAFIMGLLGHFKMAYDLAIEAVMMRVLNDIFQWIISELYTFEIHSTTAQKATWILCIITVFYVLFYSLGGLAFLVCFLGNYREAYSLAIYAIAINFVDNIFITMLNKLGTFKKAGDEK
ncbi:hypothetical protein [Puia dinghuensis]|nr:hypothetical protein [Puia dinghuensis]